MGMEFVSAVILLSLVTDPFGNVPLENAMLAGERLQRLMGDRLMQAVERLMGLILTAMAVEMLLGGIRAFVDGLK